LYLRHTLDINVLENISCLKIGKNIYGGEIYNEMIYTAFVSSNSLKATYKNIGEKKCDTSTP